MPLIPEQTLTALRAIDERAMTETFTIVDTTDVDDGAGSTIQQTSTRTTIGYFWTVSGDEAGADQIKARGAHRLRIPLSVTVDATATIIRSTGVRYSVTYVEPIATYGTSRQLGLEEA